MGDAPHPTPTQAPSGFVDPTQPWPSAGGLAARSTAAVRLPRRSLARPRGSSPSPNSWPTKPKHAAFCIRFRYSSASLIAGVGGRQTKGTRAARTASTNSPVGRKGAGRAEFWVRPPTSSSVYVPPNTRKSLPKFFPGHNPRRHRAAVRNSSTVQWEELRSETQDSKKARYCGCFFTFQQFTPLASTHQVPLRQCLCRHMRTIC